MSDSLRDVVSRSVIVGRSFEFSGDTLSIGYGNPETRATIHPVPDVAMSLLPWQAGGIRRRSRPARGHAGSHVNSL